MHFSESVQNEFYGYKETWLIYKTDNDEAASSTVNLLETHFI